MARKSYNFYRNELSLITLAVLIGFYAFTAFDICVNRYAHSMLSHDQGTADMALWTRYMEDYNERYRELSQDIDEQRMQKLYGEDWEGLFARNANVTLNDQDISRIQALYNTEGDPDNDSVLQQLSRFSFGEYDEENNQFQLYVIHEKKNQIITLNYIYFSDIYPFYGSEEMNEERFSRSIETSINQFPTLYMFTHPQAFRPYVSGIMMDEGEIDEACARFEQAVQTQSIHRRHRDAFADPHLIADHVLLLSFP
ncbi:MAG: hypothetical protein ACLTCB_03185 [Merdibacter sp.]